MTAPELSPRERRELAYFETGKDAPESWRNQIKAAITASGGQAQTITIESAAAAVDRLVKGGDR